MRETNSISPAESAQKFSDTGSQAQEVTASDPAAPGSDPNCLTTVSGAGTINAFYDPSTELINLVATLNDGSYAGWGWGATMTDTEMVIFSADGAQSGVTTVYGVGTTRP